jgi:hypothetical protein
MSNTVQTNPLVCQKINLLLLLLLRLLRLLNNLPQAIRRRLQRFLLLFVQRQFQHLLNTFPSKNHRLAQRHFQILIVHTDRPHVPLIEQDRFANTLRHAADTEFGGAFAFD